MPESDTLGKNLLNQMLEQFVLPEIEKRQETGSIPKPYDLRAFQILWCTKLDRPIIRLNQEVKAIAHMKLDEGVSINKGATIYEHQIKNIERVELLDDDKDCGHVTVIRVGEKYLIHFCFLYDRGIAKNLLESAKGYFNHAKDDLEHGRDGNCHEHLFIASELAINSLLFLIHPDHKRIANLRNHSAIFKEFGRVNPFNQPHHRTFNKLMKNRSDVKYQRIKLGKEVIISLLNDVKVMLDEIEEHSKVFY